MKKKLKTFSVVLIILFLITVIVALILRFNDYKKEVESNLNTFVSEQNSIEEEEPATYVAESPNLDKSASDDGYYVNAVDAYTAEDAVPIFEESSEYVFYGRDYFIEYIEWYLDGADYAIACDYTTQGNEEYMFITSGDYGYCFEHLDGMDEMLVSTEPLNTPY